MRVLHTSDWHLGRSLYRHDLREAQAAFISHLVDVVRAEAVDLVVVSGDIFDRAVPPVDAVQLCEDALIRLREAGARVVVISGNHDSPRRLGFNGRLADAAGVHLRTRVSRLAEPVLLEDTHGPVAVFGIPYLEPDAVRTEIEELTPDTNDERIIAARGHQGVVEGATRAIRAKLKALGHPRSVVLAHAWVTGGAAADSERDLNIGGAGQVSAALFDGFSYTALGHLHSPQTLADHLRYSGSPLPYSFSEAGHTKGSWLVDLDSTGLARAEQIRHRFTAECRCCAGISTSYSPRPLTQARKTTSSPSH